VTSLMSSRQNLMEILNNEAHKKEREFYDNPLPSIGVCFLKVLRNYRGLRDWLPTGSKPNPGGYPVDPSITPEADKPTLCAGRSVGISVGFSIAPEPGQANPSRRKIRSAPRSPALLRTLTGQRQRRLASGRRKFAR